MPTQLTQKGRNESECQVCPAEHAGWLSTPLRHLVTSPRRILRDLVHPGDIAVDLGCGPGFFTVPLAAMVGDRGTVVAVDLQQAMLDQVRTRAETKDLASRIRLHRCGPDSLGLRGEHADFALAFWMVHEVPDESRFLAEVHDLLASGARLLLVEPRVHVNREAFARTIDAAVAKGFRSRPAPRVAFSFAALLERE
jgi:ubiquinone/menaquinone biosynthesis C-methylase UbiE